MNLKKGDFISRISYLKVEDVVGNDLIVSNEEGFKWQIDKQILENEHVVSATHFDKTKKVPKTELARIFVEETGGKAFSVNFTKKTDNSERTLIGYRTSFRGYLGMSDAIDLEKEKDSSKSYDTRSRIVTHDNINWLILDGTKYTLK